MNRKLLLNIFLNIFPFASAYGVFYALLAIIKQVPAVGQRVSEIWYIPFFYSNFLFSLFNHKRI